MGDLASTLGGVFKVHPMNKKIMKIPRIWFGARSSILVEDRTYKAKRGSVQDKILSFFYVDHERVLTLDQLTDILMDKSIPEAPSVSYVVTSHANARKSVSRLRRSLIERFSSVIPPGMEWLHYSANRGGWILYKLPGLGSDGEWH